jgi:hypothetical protein
MTPGGKHGALLIVGHPTGGGDEPEPLDSPEGSTQDPPDADDAAARDDKDASCATCYAFQQSTGYCRRFPPHATEWSQVDATAWCGEWKSGEQHDENGASAATNAPDGQPPAPDQEQMS